MPPERHPADDPREWLNRARSNLALARSGPRDDVYTEDLLFDAQQAAEIRAASELSRFAHEARYPGGSPPIATADYERLVAIADSVVRWAEVRVAAIR
jgi:HEPN domain-containing protein